MRSCLAPCLTLGSSPPPGEAYTWTCRQSASAKEYTATVWRPSSLQALITLTAISPLFATKTFEKAVVVAHRALPREAATDFLGLKVSSADPILCSESLAPAQALARGLGFALHLF